jgi:hypothetical protein
MISLFIVIYFPTKLAKQETRAIMDKANSIAEMTSFNISPALLFNDSSGVEDALRSARQNKDLVYLVVFNDSNKVIASYNLQMKYIELDKQEAYTNHISPEGDVYKTVTAIIHNGREIGRLFMGMSLE